MKILIMAIIMLVAGTAGFAQTKKSAHHHHHGNMAKSYTCPMHPEVVRKHAGKCPKCHMNLVAVKKTKIQSEERANKMEKM